MTEYGWTMFNPELKQWRTDQIRHPNWWWEPFEIDEGEIEGIMIYHADSTLSSEYKFSADEGFNEITASNVNITKAAKAIKQLLE